MRPNTIALIALCNEFCQALESASQEEPRSFMASMLRLLPRIYIATSAIDTENAEDIFQQEETPLNQALEEAQYEHIRNAAAMVMGQDDTYLDAAHDDEMRFSETPVAASVSESLADIYQVAYNFIHTVEDAPDYIVEGAAISLREDFEQYWSNALCSALRIINLVYYK